MNTITAGIHGLFAAGLASMAMNVTATKEGGWLAKAGHSVTPPSIAEAVPAAPVVLTKGGFVIYDSQSRAETIAKLWNVKSVAEAAKLLKVLDKKRYRESGL